MAGRGRGRGRRLMTFSVEAVGINRGDSLPPSIQQPTPVYPVMEQKPLPLTGGEEAEYLLALKQEFRGAMKTLPSFIQPAAALRDVERYSDKYHSGEQNDALMDWTPDWKRFPKELRVRRPATDCVSAVSRSDRVQSSQKKKQVKEKEEVLLKLETLEKKEERGSSGEEEEEQGEEKKKKQEEEEADAEEEYDEEEFEEETDYIMSYFDNGEEFGGDSDENMDEAIY
ncbi:RNA polymerase III subunit GL b [Labrus bergylta]|uniref:DNA-directed RNA polymerase III subunit n=1 Tax=Labrus bergylta TaxID=56723 RepID=A0A3Q3G1D3_9LABR|nr:DNA-directed RNA polymerase III subunit RPC7-like [Labrus bergylta]XP_029131199.1 DNA-directed RNA polymerase III subunit RPC7-like [Labrus bergylta]XP_029131201.1 DNA-directed RNA polymerase III subunit RPC7-like [Labrus bergylta]